VYLKVIYLKRNKYEIYVSIVENIKLRYFLEVARPENIHRASERLKISPGSISKAVARLEEQLSEKLFNRIGRHIKLTG
jgi:DNA-binding transcriptional LysR family regulator